MSRELARRRKRLVGVGRPDFSVLTGTLAPVPNWPSTPVGIRSSFVRSGDWSRRYPPGMAPSRAEERLFALISALLDEKKPVSASGSAPVVLGEADLVREVVTYICDTTRMGDLMGCLTDHGALVANPPGSTGVPFPAQVWDDGAFADGIGTLYCHEGLCSASELSATRRPWGCCMKQCRTGSTAGTPASWRPHWPHR